MGKVPPSPPPHSALFLTQKQAYFGPKPLFLALFGPFLILFDAKTTFVALVGEIFQGSKWVTFSKGGGGAPQFRQIFWAKIFPPGGGSI